MSVLVLSADEVERLLDLPGCMAAMEEALVGLARGDAHLPLRSIVRPPGERSFLGLMPTFRAGRRPLYALKTVAIFPDNPAQGLDPHQGTVTLYDGTNGETVAIMNATPITAIRTAAVSGVATRALARQDARELAIVGAGHQAAAHVAAMLEARPFERIRIASRTYEHAARLAADWPLATAVDTAEEAVRGADAAVIVTEWPELAGLASAEVREAMRTPLIVDGRNLLDPAAVRALGFAYEAIGRPSPNAATPPGPEPPHA